MGSHIILKSAEEMQETEKMVDGLDYVQRNDLKKPCRLRSIVEQYRSLRRIFFILAALNIVLVASCIASLCFTVFNREDHTKEINRPENKLDSLDTDTESVATASLGASVVQKNSFCLSCNQVNEKERQFFDSFDGRTCCIENIASLIRHMKFSFVQSLNQYSFEVRSLKSNLDELKEDLSTIETDLYSQKRSNRTEGEVQSDIDSLTRERVQRNNRLINTVLNYRRSVLYLTGTATADGIEWKEIVKEGHLSADTDGVRVNGGGKYLVYCNIYFTSKVCNGSEKFEYFINQEYSPGEFYPVARAKGSCTKGSTADEGVLVQSVISMERQQTRALRVQYDSNIHAFISRTFNIHTLVIFEI